jgi:hypothetical protein
MSELGLRTIVYGTPGSGQVWCGFYMYPSCVDLSGLDGSLVFILSVSDSLSSNNLG